MLDVVVEGRVRRPRRRVGPGPWIFRQISSASSSTVVLTGVERLKSSFSAAVDLHRQADAVGQVAAVGVAAHLRRLAQNVQRVLALDTFWTRSGTTWVMASFTFPLGMSVSRRARRSPIPTQLNGRTIV